MNASTDTLVPRPPRFQIKHRDGLSVSVESENWTAHTLAVELIDISRGGAKIKLAEPLEAQDLLSLRLETTEPKRVIEISGQVCWVTPSSRDEYALGCHFTPELPAVVLEEFAADGFIDRRSEPRRDILLVTTAMWQLGNIRSAPGVMIDFSRGGFCLRSQVEGQVGDRVLVRIESASSESHEIPATIRWQSASPDGYILGCEFQNPREFQIVNEMAGERNKRSPQPQTARPARKLLRVLSAAFCVGSLLLACRLLMPEDATENASRSVNRASPTTTLTVANHTSNQTAPPGYTVAPTRAPWWVPIATAESWEPAPQSAVYRKWTDRDQQYYVVAKIESVEGNIVRLRRPDGRAAAAPLERLSPDDVAYVQRWRQDND